MGNRKSSNILLPETICAIESYISDLQTVNEKKAALILYWLQDYVRLLKKEETYSPTKNLNLKRGSVISLPLGFNIGSEHGGLHYAVVLNIVTQSSSGVLTIIPLGSRKKDKLHFSEVDLGDEVFRKIVGRVDRLMNECNDLVARNNTIVDKYNNSESTKLIDKMLKDESFALEVITDSNDVTRLQNVLAKHVKALETSKNRYIKVKPGGIALVGQITTISKVRIYDPVSTRDGLHGICLESATMDKIDAKIIELFTKT